MKLICSPLLGDSPAKTIYYTNAYDIYELGAFRKGEVEVAASFQQERGRLSLLVEMKRHSRGPRPSAETTFTGCIRLPLWFYRSSSCVLADLDNIKDKLPVEAFVEDDPEQAATVDAEIHVQIDGQGVVPGTQAEGAHVIDAEVRVQPKPVLSPEIHVNGTFAGLTDTETHVKRQPLTHTSPAPQRGGHSCCQPTYGNS